MSKRIFLELFLFIYLLMNAACAGVGPDGFPLGDESNPKSASTMISAKNGGTLTSSDGKLILTVPAGALSEDTEISVTPVENEGVVEYEFKPDGLQFSQPAIVTFEMDMAEHGPKVDDKGLEIDPTTGVPSVLLFLASEDGGFEMMQNSEVETEEGSSIITVTAEIPHFTSMRAVAGNSFYVYMTFLGTHYVGSDFKADVTLRYLDYSATDSYRNMSLSYDVRSITHKEFKFEDSNIIKQVTPKVITRNAFLSRRGQESATRPKFNCNAVGSGTIKVTATVDAIVEVVFQPENKTRVYSFTQKNSTTRKGKCIARVGLNNFSAGSDGTRVAMLDPGFDHEIQVDGEWLPGEGLEVPGCTDIREVHMTIHDGETLEASLVMDGTPWEANPAFLNYLSFNLAVLDNGLGFPGGGPFADALWIMTKEGIGPGSEYSDEVYQWEENRYLISEDPEVETAILENTINFLIPLAALGLNGEEALDHNYRAVTQLIFADGYPYAGQLISDSADISF